MACLFYPGFRRNGITALNDRLRWVDKPSDDLDDLQTLGLSTQPTELTPMRFPQGIRFIFTFLVGAYAYGSVIALLGVAAMLIKGEAFPAWVWWQCLVAPLAVGFFALALEAAFLPLQKILIDSDRVDHQIWKRGLRAVILIAILFGGMMALVIYRNH
ncbi:MAG: hypothetical protein HY273_02765 [Gammaproteobacteria bacterium]|nr:hypothetical protein [Gammaproteobacteria bacterium]